MRWSKEQTAQFFLSASLALENLAANTLKHFGDDTKDLTTAHLLHISSVRCGGVRLRSFKMVVITRSLVPLLRTSRLALRQQNGINPVQQIFGKDTNSIRGLATVFERSKPHVNIGKNTKLTKIDV